MTTLLIEYRVADFDEWKRVFDRDPMGRRTHGVTRHRLQVSVDDPRHFVLSLEFGSVDSAKGFLGLLQPVLEISGAQRSWVLEETEAG